MTGRVIHTGQAIVDLVMRIDAVPEPGGDTFARWHHFAVGGGFNVMAAAARDGAAVLYAGGHGTGPFGDQVRAALAGEGIVTPAAPDPALDTGFCVALVDDTAERTFVSTLGAEGRVTVEHYRAAVPAAGDVVYLTGYSLLHEDARAALLTWLPELGPEVRLVFDPSPVVAELPLDLLRTVAGLVTVWSGNARESRLVADRLGAPLPGTGPEQDAAHLAGLLGCTVLLRDGSRGAVLAGPDRAPVHLPAPGVDAIDTNGAGDAHCGVLCAALADGQDLTTAVRRANVAAALAVTREGPATAPTRAEIDAVLAGEV